MDRRRERILAGVFCTVLLSTTVVFLLWLPSLVERAGTAAASRAVVEDRDSVDDQLQGAARRRTAFGQRTQRVGAAQPNPEDEVETENVSYLACIVVLINILRFMALIFLLYGKFEKSLDFITNFRKKCVWSHQPNIYTILSA